MGKTINTQTMAKITIKTKKKTLDLDEKATALMDKILAGATERANEE